METQSQRKIHVSVREAIGLLFPYVKARVLEQVKSVWLIISYLVLFQTLILGIPIRHAAVIAVGIALVVGGLTLFMEGLVLGLMPLGERAGVKLPQRAGPIAILLFAFLLGFLATLAEPAIQVLQAAGKSVTAWEAPLLYMLLNRHAEILVYAVGTGVGIAVVLGMMRFYFSWSLKPCIFGLVLPLLLITAWAVLDPNLRSITGLAWDCGAVTTGPVTVPLVLALGVGISRMVGTTETGSTGFGVVTLASLFPVLAVLVLGISFSNSVPPPMEEEAFFSKEAREKSRVLFESEDHMAAYALVRAGREGQRAFFGEEPERMMVFARSLAQNEAFRKIVFNNDTKLFERWVREHGPPEVQGAPHGGEEGALHQTDRAATEGHMAVREIVFRNLSAAMRAIMLLTLPLFLIMVVILREKIPLLDEMLLGLGLAVGGLFIFSIGIEIGLDKLGTQVGSMLPASFQPIDLSGERSIAGFDPSHVHTAISLDGEKHRFFYLMEGKEWRVMPFKEGNYDSESGRYLFHVTKGPIFGREGSLLGISVVLLFAFVMGYGATLAEPALNALGLTVEELTVGTFRKSLLMQSVALGVGIGLCVGVAKIIWDIPLAWLLIPSYTLLLPVTMVSSEEFVNVAWDSAGVTTGPITVPLVLSMGLGIGSQVGVMEGFGILAAASVFPILSVLTVGLYMDRVRKAVLGPDASAHEEGLPANE